MFPISVQGNLSKVLSSEGGDWFLASTGLSLSGTAIAVVARDPLSGQDGRVLDFNPQVITRTNMKEVDAYNPEW